MSPARCGTRGASWGHLRSFAGTLGERPRAILVVSGHWEEASSTVNAGAALPLLFDYGNFPAHTDRLTWPAAGEPDLAMRVCDLLGAAKIESSSDTSRDRDHGVFAPLKVMFPLADIPTVQLLLQHGLDPATHLAIARALRPLREEAVLIVGSGQTDHNMGGFMGGSGSADPAAEAFDAWLREAMTGGTTRDRSLTEWERAPGARQAQPHGAHLLPLMVAAGAASGEPGQTAFHGYALGKPISGFRFG